MKAMPEKINNVLRELLLHAGLLLVVLAATVAGYNNPAPLVIQPDTSPQRMFGGFHSIEYSAEGDLPFRWTKGAGAICLEQVGYAPLHAVSITLLGKGATALGVDEVTFLVDDRPVVTTALRPARQRYTFLIDGHTRQHDDLCLTIASTTVQSSAAGEQRHFGVPFHELVLYRSAAGGLILPALWQLGLNIAAALVAFWLLRVWRLRAEWAAAALALLALLAGLLVLTEAVGAGLDAARSLLPTTGIALLLLLGSLGLRWIEREQPAPLPWLNRRLTRDLLLMVVWSVLLWGGVRVLQEGYSHSGVWPLKAGVWPDFTAALVVPIMVFTIWLALVLRQLGRPAPRRDIGVLLLLLGAIALPVLLKTSVRGWDFLYFTFRDNPSDYIYDVPLVGSDPPGFLGSYVARSPDLAWHNANHPPGSVMLLWVIAQTLGPGAVHATWAIISLSSLAALAAAWLGQRIGGWHLALLAGVLVVVMPGHQVYSVTSMDALFNAINALAAVACFLALEPGARPWRAVLAGGLLALGLFFTYATTQLAFFGAALALLALLRGQPWRVVLRQGALVVGTLAGSYLLLYLLTGFNVVAGVVQASANNARLLGEDADAFGVPTLAHYVYYLGVNIVPFGWYLGPWGLAALTPQVRAAVGLWRRPTSRDVLLLALLALVAGMWGSGLFIREVERIWGFVYPLAAVLIAAHAWQGTTQRERLWRAGLYVALFFAQSVVMRALLNTYW